MPGLKQFIPTSILDDCDLERFPCHSFFVVCVESGFHSELLIAMLKADTIHCNDKTCIAP